MGTHSIRISIRALLYAALPVVSLTACSSFVQQPAPVERPAGMVTNAGTAKADVQPVEAPVAKATPYRQGGSLSSPATPQAGGTYVVQPGENLFRISLNHKLKYQDVAKWNNLQDYNIKAGQVLRLTPPDGQGQPPTPAATADTQPVPGKQVAATGAVAAGNGTVKTWPKALKLPYSDDAVKHIAAQSEGAGKSATPVRPQSSSAPVALARRDAGTSASAPAASSDKAAAGEDAVNWLWPTDGKLIKGYSDSNKGLDIGGRSGQAILAAGDGKVVYSGNGLRGYGKLIIIKHNKTFLSAYAHNSQLLVKEGQAVKKGQKIAEMGNTDADQVKLHFEIRRFGKPVDPMQYLDNKT